MRLGLGLGTAPYMAPYILCARVLLEYDVLRALPYSMHTTGSMYYVLCRIYVLCTMYYALCTMYSPGSSAAIAPPRGRSWRTRPSAWTSSSMPPLLVRVRVRARVRVRVRVLGVDLLLDERAHLLLDAKR